MIIEICLRFNVKKYCETDSSARSFDLRFFMDLLYLTPDFEAKKNFDLVSY
jgi:hypothetical protein